MSKYRMFLFSKQKYYYGETMEDCILEAAIHRSKSDNMELQACMDEIIVET